MVEKVVSIMNDSKYPINVNVELPEFPIGTPKLFISCFPPVLQINPVQINTVSD